jgi:hypothetical protein
MLFNTQKIDGQRTAGHVILLLSLNGIHCKRIKQNDSFVLFHDKTKREFHELVVCICNYLDLQSQTDRWQPASPLKEYTTDDSGYGYHVCPIAFIDDYDEDNEGEYITKFDCDFDMTITSQEVAWC